MNCELYKSGFIAIIGSPNVGKSTLMNAFIGQKVAIVSPKAQTTRNAITGILTEKHFQVVFIDTPGIIAPKNKLGEFMSRSVSTSAREVDGILMVVDSKFGIEERDIGIVKKYSREKFFVALNKLDLVGRERIELLSEKLVAEGVNAQNIFPICAKTGEGTGDLLRALVQNLPEGPMYYPEDMVTDRPERFIAAELIREATLYHLSEEVPHGVGVEIEKIEQTETLTRVSAAIYCEKQSHKGIIIGKGGLMLKRIATDARFSLEMLFGTKVFLEVFVKVKEDWRNSPSILATLGYKDNG